MILKNNKYILILFLLLIALAAGLAVKYYTGTKELAARQEMIHEKGALVMPFDLAKTTHVFSNTDTGSFMQVKAKDANDTEQIALIRSHLIKEAQNFENADFSDPKALHGENMPGLAVLSASKGKYAVDYQELVDGAQLTFTTTDPNINNALHMWFMAQMTDHGSDATSM